MVNTSDLAKGGEQKITLSQVKALRSIERNKLKQYVRQRRQAERLMIENINVRTALKELGEKGKVESLIPLGGGVLVEGTIAVTTYKRTLPGNVIVPATKKEVEKELDERQAIIEEEMRYVGERIEDTRMNINGYEAMMDMARENAPKKKKR